MFDVSTIDDHFPMPSYRGGQKRAIEFACEAFGIGKRLVVLECPTGSGKSAIGMTLADMVPNSYYLTATKVLQDQLTRDFGSQIIDLKGKNAYPCTYWQRFGDDMIDRKGLSRRQLNEILDKKPSCSEGYCRQSDDKGGCLKCFPVDQPASLQAARKGSLHVLPPAMRYSACPYYEQVYRAMASRKVVMNFSSFLYQTQYTDRFGVRDLLIADEAHNIESQLLDFVSLTLTDQHLRSHGIFIPPFDTPYEYALWFEEVKLDSVLVQAMAEAQVNGNLALADDYARIQQKYKAFMEHISNPGSEWIAEFTEHKQHRRSSHNSVTLRPVFVRQYAPELLFKHANYILMMSATILDVGVFCSSLGISRDQVAAYRMKNRFSVKNRPIYVQPAAKATGGKEAMKNWGPKLVKAVNKIMLKYKGQRGIIHTHNFAIAELLLRDCDAASRKRFLFQREFEDKTDMLAEHAKQQDSVIVAPAMHEGIDLVGDLSRFQILCKVPYANFVENKQLARRMELDKNYYTWITALKLVQSVGRSVRSEDDWADTYIIDASIDKFIGDAQRILPDWFLESITRC